MNRYGQPRDPHPLGERVTLLEHGMAQFRAETQSGFAQINQRFDSLDRELSAANKSRGDSFWKIIGVIVPLMSVGALGLTQFIKVETSPLATKSDISERDRADLRGDLGASLSTLAGHGREIAGLTAKLIEIETQFCAADSVRELERESLRGEIDALRRELKLGPLPDVDYFPRIGRCQPQS